MYRLIICIVLQCAGLYVHAQNQVTFLIIDSSTSEPLGRASAESESGSKVVADSRGMASLNRILDGFHRFSFQFIGYKSTYIQLTFPRSTDTVVVTLARENEELDEVVISSTRTSRTIRSIPTRVEVLGREELEEKANMKPGDIRMMLNESTGIQSQQISATSANSSIRIQGLDGRYTQILKDGFPVYSGFSGGLGLLQTPPLDLKQVEIIKGSASTLYGGGAIAGLVNLVSKTPGPEQDLRILVNATSAHGADLNGFYSKRGDKAGITLYAGESINGSYDPSTVGFSAIPRFQRFVFNPKLFLYFSTNTTLTIGINAAIEHRVRGDMEYLRGQGDSVHRYFERNNSNRYSVQTSLNHRFDSENTFQAKFSLNRFKRAIAIPDYVFNGAQWSAYGEVSFSHRTKKTEWVAGLNLYTDDFKEKPNDTFPKRNYYLRTFGVFIQNTWTPLLWLETEAGLRTDQTNGYGVVVLPRVSALVKYSSRFSSRIGGGLGYKVPTIFTEEAERIQFRSVYPVSPLLNTLERSYGVNADINYRESFGELGVSINQLFFFTRIQKPLLTDTLPGNSYRLTNHPGFLDSKGFETNLKLTFRKIKLFVGYTFTDAHLKEDGQYRENPLTARHRLNNVLVYEKEGKWKAGLEGYYYSRQPLNDNTYGKAYWTFGFMAERAINSISLFVNFENITDTRQTRFDTIYSGTASSPTFRDIYAPLDGFVINGGVKLKL